MTVSRKILIVDDDPAIRHALRRTFENDYEVVVAADGVAGLEAMTTESPDMVILDVTMPGMDGRDVIARMKTDATLQNIPTVFLTAKADHLSRIHGLQLGAVDYFEKPFDLDMLKRRVERILYKSTFGNDGATLH